MTAPAPLPPRIARLPRDRHARPVPWFVAVIDGVPDFRIVAQGKVGEAVSFGKCFVCGEALGRWRAFPVGPLCTINRTAPEPPTHKDCAIYAAQNCPFLTRPAMRRREAGLPAGLSLATHAPGASLGHNPGATAIWITERADPFPDGKGGLLFRMGPPSEVLWFAEGRAATRAEALAALAEERETLRALVEASGTADVAAELLAVDKGYEEALRILPPA